MEPTRRRPGVAVAVLLATLLTACSDTAPKDATAEQSASATPTTAAFERYVALGDSFTAAPGVPQTDLAGGCFRSDGNYPSLLADELEVPTFVDRSCSGASTRDMSRPQTIGDTEVPAQLEAVTPETDLVTLGIGGNDFDLFSTLVSFCPSVRDSDPGGSPCRDAMSENGDDLARADLARTQARLIRLVRRIRDLAPDATIALVGYPRLAPESGTCPELLPLASGDYPYVFGINRDLTRMVRQAAARTGTTYIDVWKASRGHDICSDAPWVNGQVSDQARALQFHPFAEGQAAVADLVLDQIS